MSGPLSLQNFPNPFNPTTTIEYAVGSGGPVSMRIFDTAGRLVRTLVNEEKIPGRYSIMWDGRNDSGTPVASGTYFYELTVGDNRSGRKMVLLR